MQEARREKKLRRGTKARVKNQVPASCSRGTLTQSRTEHHPTSHRTTTSRLLQVPFELLALWRFFGHFSGRMPHMPYAHNSTDNNSLSPAIRTERGLVPASHRGSSPPPHSSEEKQLWKAAVCDHTPMLKIK